MSQVKIKEEDFSNPSLIQFLKDYEEDILIYHPDFELETAEMGNFLVLYSDDKIIGVFIYQAKGDEMHVDVDYIIKEERDKGVGIFFYGRKLENFKKLGFSSVFAIAGHPLYQKYLEGIGFKPASHLSQLYTFELN